MVIWIELSIFLVAIAFGFWQLHDVKKAQAERRARESADAASASVARGEDTKAHKP